jgi:methionyl-tRNA formyltransferase
MKLLPIVFIGTPEFGVPTLKKLAEHNYKPEVCITQPDKPQGRRQRLTPPAVKIAAKNLDIPVWQPENVNDASIVQKLREINPKVIIVVAYGAFLKKSIRELPDYGCLNLHPSLLPKYRGAAPINYALFNGDNYTGNTVFRLTAKMDAGPILYQNREPIHESENYTQLYERLSLVGAEDVLKTLSLLETDDVVYRKQNESEATYSNKLNKKDMIIAWDNDAHTINNKVRGLATKPGAITYFDNKILKIIQTELSENKSKKEPGTVVEIRKNAGIVVATETNDLLLTEVQPQGKKIMSAYAFTLGSDIKVGDSF